MLAGGNAPATWLLTGAAGVASAFAVGAAAVTPLSPAGATGTAIGGSDGAFAKARPTLRRAGRRAIGELPAKANSAATDFSSESEVAAADATCAVESAGSFAAEVRTCSRVTDAESAGKASEDTPPSTAGEP